MYRRLGAAVLAAGLFSSHAHGQQQIEWKQVSDLDVGLNMPADVSADIRGMRLGESYAVIRPKLEAISKDREGVDGEPEWEESDVSMRMQTAAGNWIEASWNHPGTIRLTRDMKGSELVVGSTETIWVQFSGPSSGSQATEIHRLLSYNEQHRQVRISEIVDDLSKKFKSQPQVSASETHARYWWQFNDGHPFVSPIGIDHPLVCAGRGLRSPNDSTSPEYINKDGNCDVLMEVQFAYGISNDHAKSIWFKLSDLERGKQNLATDNKFFDDYLASLVKNTGGAKPDL